MKRIKLLLISILLLSPGLLLAQEYSGKNLYLFGDSPISMGRGGTGVASFGTDLFYLNPASIANAERMGLSLQYGNLFGSIYNPDITIAVPTAYGTIGGSFRMVNIPDGTDMTKGYSFSLGAGKDLTSKVMVGLSFDFLMGDANDNSNLFYYGTKVGSIYCITGMDKK